MRIFLIFVALVAATPAFGCNVIPYDQIISTVTSSQYRESDMRLLELRLRDYDNWENGLPGPSELVVLSEHILRGGSDSRVVIQIYAGKNDGICEIPAEFDVQMDWSAPYQISFSPSQTEGHPDVTLAYRFFANNAFDTDPTNNAYVAEDRVAYFTFTGSQYDLVNQKPIEE